MYIKFLLQHHTIFWITLIGVILQSIPFILGFSDINLSGTQIEEAINSDGLKLVHIVTLSICLPIAMDVFLDLFSTEKGSDWEYRPLFLISTFIPSFIFIYNYDSMTPLKYLALYHLNFISFEGVVHSMLIKTNPNRIKTLILILSYISYVLSCAFKTFSVTYYTSSIDTARYVTLLGIVISMLVTLYYGCIIIYNSTVSYQRFKSTKLQNFSEQEFLFSIYITLFVLLTLLIWHSRFENGFVTFSHLNERYFIKVQSYFVFFGSCVSVLPGRLSRIRAEISQHVLRTKGTFVRYISHEIRSPLNVVYAGLEMVLRDITEIKGASHLSELLQDIYTSTQSAINLLNDLLHYENMEANTFQLDCTWRKLEDACTLKFKSLSTFAMKSNITLIVQDTVSLFGHLPKKTKNVTLRKPNGSTNALHMLNDDVQNNNNVQKDVQNSNNVQKDISCFDNDESTDMDDGSEMNDILKSTYIKSHIPNNTTNTNTTTNTTTTNGNYDNNICNHSSSLLSLTNDKMIVHIDVVRVEQILRNLVTNAIKFTPSGGQVTIRTSILPLTENTCNKTFPNLKKEKLSHRNSMKDSTTDASLTSTTTTTTTTTHNNNNNNNNNKLQSTKYLYEQDVELRLIGALLIEVIDTGVGIASENQSKLFSEFVQFDKNKLQQGNGSGLGLWISRRLAEYHKGILDFYSLGLGKGCTFYLKLPIYEIPHGFTLKHFNIIPRHTLRKVIKSSSKMKIISSNTMIPVENALNTESLDNSNKYTYPSMIAPTIDAMDLTNGHTATNTTTTTNMTIDNCNCNNNNNNDDDIIQVMNSLPSPILLPNNIITTTNGTTTIQRCAEFSTSFSKTLSKSTLLPPPPLTDYMETYSIESNPTPPIPTPGSPVRRTSTPKIGIVTALTEENLHEHIKFSQSQQSFHTLSPILSQQISKPEGISVPTSEKLPITTHSISGKSIHCKFENARILIVDDSTINRKILKRLFEYEASVFPNVFIDEAQDGDIAIEKVKQSIIDDLLYDYILMDCYMVKMDGTTATIIMRKKLNYHGIIIGVTGNACPDEIASYMRCGLDDILVKPIGRSKILHLFEKFMLAHMSDQSNSESSSTA